MGCLFRILLLLIFAVVIGVPGALVMFGLESTPLVERPGQVSMDDLRQAQFLAQRYDPRRMDPAKITTVTASEAELNTVLKGALSQLRQAAARVSIGRQGVLAGITGELPIPQNPFGRYINVRLAVAPSREGLEITRVAIGRIELPPALVLPAVQMALDRFVGDGKGRPVVESVRSVNVTGKSVSVAFRPPPSLIDDLKTAALRQVKVSHPRTVLAYWQALNEQFARVPQNGHVSLVEFVRPLFRLAQERSETRHPVRENEGALIALAMFFGDARFEKFVGEVIPAAERSRQRRLEHVRLDGRHDFVQHFAMSIGLTLTGGTTAADLIGELKEVKDSAHTSGFSFTDIGADRMGVRFAQRAVADEETAERFQATLAAARDERSFFPRFADLPEGMSEAAFRSRFGDVGSPAYQKMIAEIDRRIGAVALTR